MVEIGGKPILWHIMKMYSVHGINEFIVCLGYKGYMIKDYFANYLLHMSDTTIDLRKNSVTVLQRRTEPWVITLVDTGDHSMTGGRLLRVGEHIRDEEVFCLTYGDGVSDLDIGRSIEFHRRHGKHATITATLPPGRFGALEIRDGQVTTFREKPHGDGGTINGGFFVLSPRVLKYIDHDAMSWEQEPLSRLAVDGQLMAYEHFGFWQPMDTLRDKQLLESLWAQGNAPWKKWA